MMFKLTLDSAGQCWTTEQSYTILECAECVSRPGLHHCPENQLLMQSKANHRLSQEFTEMGFDPSPQISSSLFGKYIVILRGMREKQSMDTEETQQHPPSPQQLAQSAERVQEEERSP